MQLFKDNKAVATVVIILLLLGILLGYNAALVFLSIYATYTILDNKLSNRIFNSVFYKILTAFILYATILQIVAMAAWLFDRNFPLNITVLITLIVLGVSYAWTIYIRKPLPIDREPLKKINHFDLLSIVIGIFILILIVAAPVIKSFRDVRSLNIPGISFSLMDADFDDSSHLSRINDRLELDRGVIYKSNEVNYVVDQNTISTYPSGWYIANAILIKSVDSSIKVGGQSLIAYVITKLFWIFILVYCFSRVSFGFVYYFKRSKTKKRSLSKYAWIFGSVTFFSYYVILENFKEGFYTYIPLLISITILIPMLIQLSLDKPGRKTQFIALLPIILIVTNLTLTWFLIFPAVALAVFIAIIRYEKSIDLKTHFLEIYREVLDVLPLIVFSVLAILAQLIIILAPSSQSFRVGVDTAGGIALPSDTFYIFVFAGSILMYIFTKRIYINVLDNVYLLLVSLLGFSLFIYLFQIATIHSAQYYFFKTLDTAIMVALPLAVVGWAYLVEYIDDQDGVGSWLVTISILIALPLVVGIASVNDPGLLEWVKGDRSISINEGTYFYKNISVRATTPFKQREDTIIFYVPNNTGDSSIATNLLQSVQPLQQCNNQVEGLLYTDTGYLTKSDLAVMNQKYCSLSTTEIITRNSTYNNVLNLVRSSDLSSKVKVIQIQ